MMGNDPIDPMNAPEILFDGLTEIKIIEGVARAALCTRRDGESIIVGRIAVPISELPEVIQALVIVLTEAAKIIVKPAMMS